jgi:hypothetical protein
MSRILRRRPSPSMVVAFIALSVALAGTATALPGRGRVTADDIKRAAVRSTHVKSRAVQSKHIKSRAVTRSKIARRAVGSSEVGQDALTGENIVESSLGTVSSASNATNAGTVNGRSVEKLSFVAGPGAGPTRLLDLNGLLLYAACNAGPALVVTATASAGVNNAFIHAGGTHTAGGTYYNEDDSFGIGDSFNVVDNQAGGATGSSNLQGTLTFARLDGVVVTATFLAEEAGGGCLFAGTATG